MGHEPNYNIAPRSGGSSLVKFVRDALAFRNASACVGNPTPHGAWGLFVLPAFSHSIPWPFLFKPCVSLPVNGQLTNAADGAIPLETAGSVEPARKDGSSRAARPVQRQLDWP